MHVILHKTFNSLHHWLIPQIYSPTSQWLSSNNWSGPGLETPSRVKSDGWCQSAWKLCQLWCFVTPYINKPIGMLQSSIDLLSLTSILEGILSVIMCILGCLITKYRETKLWTVTFKWQSFSLGNVQQLCIPFNNFNVSNFQLIFSFYHWFLSK